MSLIYATIVVVIIGVIAVLAHIIYHKKNKV